MSIYTHKIVNDKKVKLTADEIKELEARDVEWAKGEYDRLMASIREERTELLDKTEWTVNNDNQLTDDKKTEWKVWRQKLRDITKGVDTVDKAKAVTMPEKPK
jgi:vacuolar-type H+-ATPase subunit I/STV1